MERLKELKRRWKRSLEKRRPWEQGYQECYDYTLPGKQSFFERNLTADAPEIYDETAVIGIQEFASRIQAGICPNYSKWIKLEAGSDVPEEMRPQVNMELEKVTDVFFEYLHASNFSEEAHECLIDIALGTAAMEVLEGDALNPLVFAATPLPELSIDCGPRDELDTFFRARKMYASSIEKSYGVKVPADLRKQLTKQDEESDDPKLMVVVGVYRDTDKENEYVYRRCVFLPDASDDAGVLKDDELKGLGANPFIGFRWSKVAGEAWGRGPVYNLMPAIRVANLVAQLTLENAELAIAGLYFYEDDGVINPDNVLLRPGTMVPVAPGSGGIRQFNSSSDFNVGDLIYSRLQENIKKGLFNETLGRTDTTPMSATEVAQRMADLSRQIGSAFGRLQVEFINQVINRCLYVLKRRGIIDLPTVNGKLVKIVATSPLSQAQAVEEINATTNWLTTISQFYGPEGLNLYTDGSEVARYTQDKFGVPERLFRNEESRAKMVQDMAMAQQGMQGNMPPEGM